MKMKGVILEWGGITFWTIVLTIIILGVLIAVFSMNLIPGLREGLMSILGVGG